MIMFYFMYGIEKCVVFSRFCCVIHKRKRIRFYTTAAAANVNRMFGEHSLESFFFYFISLLIWTPYIHNNVRMCISSDSKTKNICSISLCMSVFVLFVCIEHENTTDKKVFSKILVVSILIHGSSCSMQYMFSLSVTYIRRMHIIWGLVCIHSVR